MSSSQMLNQHLLWRAGFGPTIDNVANISTYNTKDLYASIQKASNKSPQAFNVATNVYQEYFGINAGDANGGMMTAVQKITNLSKEQKQQIQKQSREDLKKLNTAWMNEMVSTDAQLREKMSLFWHGHFACRNNNIYYQQLLLQDVRANALGNFGDLLRSVSKSAAMLAFLNNQQNRKEHPNENFAREVMELFTLGRGNYTEQDIKEAARAFTGWSFDINGGYVFRMRAHDEGRKTIFGKTGNYTGDDVLNMLLEQKQTAKFITQKIYKYFVNDIIDQDKVNALADKFYQSNYNIDALMQNIFTSTSFYDAKNIGTRIKSPVELLVGIRRVLPMEMENEDIQLLFQRVLGQLLFYPPNVAGWAGGKNWIDSSTLMLRLQIPRLIKDDDEFHITPKTDDDQQMGMKDNMQVYKNKMKTPGAGGYRINANVNWEKYTDQFNYVSKEDLLKTLAQTLLQTPPDTLSKIVAQNVDNSSRQKYIETATIAFMSTPEYQLC